MKVKYPDIDKDENRIFKKAEENFKKKTGLTIEQVQMIESEKEKMKYVMESVKIILQTFEEEVSKARRTLDTEIKISVEKKQNKWIVLEDVFEFMEKIYD